MTLDEDAIKVVDELIAHADSIGLHSKPIIIAALRRCAEAMREECAKELVRWAQERWDAEVRDRPFVNKYRRTLDDTWKQVGRDGPQAIRRVEVK